VLVWGAPRARCVRPATVAASARTPIAVVSDASKMGVRCSISAPRPINRKEFSAGARCPGDTPEYKHVAQGSAPVRQGRSGKITASATLISCSSIRASRLFPCRAGGEARRMWSSARHHGLQPHLRCALCVDAPEAHFRARTSRTEAARAANSSCSTAASIHAVQDFPMDKIPDAHMIDWKNQHPPRQHGGAGERAAPGLPHARRCDGAGEG